MWNTFNEAKEFCSEFMEHVEGVEDRVIIGIRMDIDSEKLRWRLKARSIYHKKRAEFWEDQAMSAQEKLDDGEMHMTGNPADDARNRARTSLDKAAHFQFIAENLISGKIYRLSERDMQQYELNKREE